MRFCSLQRHGVLLVFLPLVIWSGCRDTAKPGLVDASRTAVTAQGRVVPGRGVVFVAGIPHDKVVNLNVKEGDMVEAGTPLAMLSSHAVRKAERDAAHALLRETRERLAAETRVAEVMIAQATAALKLLEAHWEFDRSELARMEALRAGEAVAGRRLDEQIFLVRSRALAVDKARVDLELAEAGLIRTRAAIGLKSAEAAVATAEAQLALAVIKAPSPGVVLKVLVRPGEQISAAPILQLGDTANMYVVAEVHANDIGAVKIGQRATISGNGLKADAAGEVEEVGLLIHKNDVLNLDPRADSDTRVVEVRIRMDDATAFAALANLEVFVRIDLQPAVAGAEKKSTGRP